MAGGGVGEYLAQKIEQGTGDRETVDPLQVGIATAIPAVVAGAGRVIRGVGRTITRVLPSQFRAAHEGALGAAKELGEGLAPEVNAGQMFKAARAAGADTIPANKTAAMLADLEKSIPKTPASPALKTVREFMTNLDDALVTKNPYNVPAGVGTTSPGLTLEALMAMRRDLGASIGKAPEIKALYKGLIQDLDVAAKAGGPGASMAKEALGAFKQDLGVSKLAELVEGATSRRAIAGADTQVLNMAKFAKSFSKDAKEYADLLGPEGVQQVGAFIQRFKSLPPEVAWNGWNIMLGTLFGAGGLAGGNLPAAAAGFVGQELLRNAIAVGKNPKALNQYMTTLVQAARSAAVSQPEEP